MGVDGGGSGTGPGTRPVREHLRVVVLVSGATMPVLLVVLGLLDLLERPPLTGELAPLVLLVIGVASLLESLRYGRQPLRAGDVAGLVAAYQRRVVLRLGLAQALGLLGFVAAFLGAGWLLVMGALLFSAAGTWAVAPTDAALARHDEDVRAVGDERTFARVLDETPASSAR